MRPAPSPAVEDAALLQQCRDESMSLLRRNLSPGGILAASPGDRADARGYTAIFGRDAAICSLGMALSGDEELEEAAMTGLITLAKHQAPNGQIPKIVDWEREEADFWYLGCIDATLWWLVALAFVDVCLPRARLRERFHPEVELALMWLGCQEHQRFFLLQQNEASDWADIMPRSGFVLYTNALWLLVKRLYRLGRATETRVNFNQLFHPFDASIADYRRARLLSHYARSRARNRDLHLSFVNFSFVGDEGDVFGNLLGIVTGAVNEAAAHRTIKALERAGVHEPFPARVVCDPIPEDSPLWRPYMSRHRQNYAWQYHNGGVWPFIGGFWVMALAATGLRSRAHAELVKVARANAIGGWSFNEWLHGETFEPEGMPGQSWNAAMFLAALHTVETGRTPFDLLRTRAARQSYTVSE